MTRLVKLAGALAVAAAMTVLPMTARADDKDTIDYRQNIMKALDAHTAALGMMVSTQIEPSNIQKHVDAIALNAKAALKSFEAKVPGGDTKPEVWDKWDDFSKRMNEFAANADAMAKAAKTGGVPVIMDQMVTALTCKGCHDVYRVKK